MRNPAASIHVAKIVRKHKGKVYVSYLLRQSYRQDRTVKHRTLGNLSHLPERIIDLIRRSLQGESFVTPDQAFRTLASKPHGHVEAVLTTFRKLELDNLIASQPSRQRALILALMAQRLLAPCSKLATTRLWHTTTLAEELQVADADSKALYAALDWLVQRQPDIEKKLAARHLGEGGVVLYDVSSSYYEGQSAITCEEGLDGIYVIRTSEKKKTLSTADCVRTYKSLSQVEQAFRCLKGLDLQVRPIRHRVDPRVRAHLFLCMLAYYVEWHMRQALAPLLYADEELVVDRWDRDPVKPAKPSASAKAKKKTHETADGLPVHSFATLLAHLASRCRNTHQLVSESDGHSFQQVTEPDAVQTEALRLLQL
jgi:hypothetical protein